MAPTKKKKLGEVLRDRGSISSADLSKALEDQQGKVIHLGELMLERGLVSKPDLVAALAEVTRVPYVDCVRIRVDGARCSAPECPRLLHRPASRSQPDCCTAGNRSTHRMSSPLRFAVV